MAKCAYMLILAALLLCACSSQTPNNELPSSGVTSVPNVNDTLAEIISSKPDTSSYELEPEDEPAVHAPAETPSVIKPGDEPTVQENIEPSSIVEPEDAPTEPEMILPPSEMPKYLDFLHNEAAFYEYIDNDWNPINEYEYESFADYLHGEDGFTLKVEKFAIIDMNDDGIKELIISMKHPASASVREIILVLTCDNSTLYGIMFTSRYFSSLKKDGTYISSGVAPGHWGVMKLLYSSGAFHFEETRSPNYYEFGEEFSAFTIEQDLKEEAEWFPYIEETIAEDLVAAWESNATT